MPESTEQRVSTEFVVVDHASKALEGLVKGGERAERGMERLTGLFEGLATAGGLVVGGLGFERLYESTEQTFESVKRISRATGMAAEDADGLSESFAMAGMNAGETESILLRLSRQGARAQQTFAGMTGMTGSLRAQMALVGVDIRKGPLQSILDMSKAAEKGKLDTGKLSGDFTLPLAKANDLMELLQQGPGKIKASIAALKNSGNAVSEKNLDDLESMHREQRKFTLGWRRIQIILGQELFPVVTNLMREMNQHLPEWIGYAKSFAGVLKWGLTDGLGVAKALTKVLLLNAVIQRGTAMGLGGSDLKGERGGGTGLFGTANKVAGSFFATPEKGLGVGIEKTFAGLTGTFGKLARASMGLLKMGVVATIIDRIVVGFQQFRDNVGGIASYLTEDFDQLMGALAPLGRLFDATFGKSSPIDSAGTSLAELWRDIIPLALDGAMKTITFVIEGLGTFFGFMGEQVGFLIEIGRNLASGNLKQAWTLTKDMMSPSSMKERIGSIYSSIHSETLKGALAQKKAREDAARASEIPHARGGTNYNFPNARFDIQQQFAEGYDPDRIAVAFADSVAEMGTRRRMSQLTPMHAVR